MSSKGFLSHFFFSLFCLCIFEACNNSKPPETAIVNTPEELEIEASDIIRNSIEYATENEGKIDDSIQLNRVSIDISSFFSNNINFRPTVGILVTWQKVQFKESIANATFQLFLVADENFLFPHSISPSCLFRKLPCTPKVTGK